MRPRKPSSASKKNFGWLKSRSHEKWVLKNVSAGYWLQTPTFAPDRCRSEGRHQTRSYSGEKRALLFAWKVLQAREVQRHCVCARKARPWALARDR